MIMGHHFQRALWSAVALAVVAAAPTLASAQPLCKDSETVVACWLRLQLGPEGQKKVAEQQQAARKTETSLADISGLSSSVRDFLPLLQMSGVLGAMETDDKTGVVTMALNAPFAGAARSPEGETEKLLQLRATVESKAKLYEPLEKALPAQNREALSKQLLASKKDALHLTVQGSYNVSSNSFGRSFVRHAEVLQALTRRALKPNTDGADAESQFLKSAASLLTGLSNNVNMSKTAWKDMSSEDRAVVQKLLPDLVAREATADAEFESRWKAAGLDLYGQLVLNQPQLQLSATHSFRDDLFGPDLTVGRVTFEMGLGNSLNAALGSLKETCHESGEKCFDAYRKFTDKPGTRAAIKAGTRVAAYAEVVHNPAYVFLATAPVLNMTMKAGTGWTAGLDAGRLLAVDDDGTAGGRVDASLKWEAPGDKSKDSRFVAALTVTKKVGELSVPLGIVYANKEKYLTGVDHGLSAHVGLKFSLFNGAK
ncbi:MAG TPA: hypothetical protein VMZ90_14255 [Vicinamibacterales bacterium]|nr:hypothetical protein [Vicinamibacterales bacterium]